MAACRSGAPRGSGGLRSGVTLRLLALAGLAAVLAGCGPGSPVAGGPASGSAPGNSGTAPPPSSAVAVAPATTRPATAAPVASSPANTRPALSREARMKLDRQLVLAAKANDVALVRKLIRDGGNVNAKDAIQDSAFLYAGAEGFNDVLRLTLDNGADVASTNRFGGTALIPASEHGHVETVRILIAAGVPVNHVNNLGWTALQEAILLNNGGPNQQEVVRQLLAAGADPNIRDPQGRTALENADRLGFAEIARLIRSHR